MRQKRTLLNYKKWADAGLLSKQRASSRIKYTESPSSKLSIAQILRGERRAIWETSQSETIEVKKAIVITDWFCAQDAFDSQRHFTVYQMLFEQGFPIYVWGTNQLIPIRNSKDLRQALKAVTPVQHPPITARNETIKHQS